MAKVVDLIKDNAELLMRLRNSGYRNIDNLTDAFCVYQIYLSFDNIKEKMERYEATAIKSKVSISTIMDVVKKMEKNI
jgi:hypothetical protein